jgi:hypothetical protein
MREVNQTKHALVGEHNWLIKFCVCCERRTSDHSAFANFDFDSDFQNLLSGNLDGNGPESERALSNLL